LVYVSRSITTELVCGTKNRNERRDGMLLEIHDWFLSNI